MELTDNGKIKNKRYKAAVDLSSMVYGKVPPQAKALEESVLGEILYIRGAIEEIQEILTPESFYVDAHQRIYKACLSLQKKSLPIDILTVVEELSIAGELDMVGGPYFVTKLTDKVVSAGNIIPHARIIMQKFKQREVIRVSGEMIGLAYEDATNPHDLVDQMNKETEKLLDIGFVKRGKGMAENSASFLQAIDHRMNHKTELTGVPSGFVQVDQCTWGWQSTDLIILAARPSVGKTAYALNLARNAVLPADSEKEICPTYFFSLEMSEQQLTERIYSAESEIPLADLQRGNIEPESYKKLIAAIGRMENRPLVIDDEAGITWMDVKTRLRKWAKEHRIIARGKGKQPPKLLAIIDYLQLMSDVTDGVKRNREQEISSISRNLKKIAKDLDIALIALSQLSRAGEGKTSGKARDPILSDLRESGAIEQDADLVIFLYEPSTPDHKSGEIHHKIAKHRGGALQTIQLLKRLHIQRFYNFDDQVGGVIAGEVKSDKDKQYFFIGGKLKNVDDDNFDTGFKLDED